MSKEDVLSEYGLGDGNDDLRWEYACSAAQENDINVLLAFKTLLKMENEGLVFIINGKYYE